MKPIISIFLLMLTITTSPIFSQSNTLHSDDSTVQISQRAQVFFGELLGNGLLITANYDFRFGNSQKGFGMRLGIGYFGLGNDGILTIPIAINHLAGKAPNYFESGLGITYASLSSGSAGIRVNGSGTVIVPSIGYRYQPDKKGFFGRVSLSPLFSMESGGGVIPFWGGFGLGMKL